MATRYQAAGRVIDSRQIRSTRRWRSLARQVCTPGSLCAKCYEPIVFGLRPSHPLGPSVDHVIPLERGGDPFDLANLVPMHFGCNSSKGAKISRQSASW
ncbi:MAG: hypothetical protein BGO26_10235 [Actinobacteria bacterium 69-20]|nr:HNH endonuclease [Actinomycetota bacterium]OJV23276.1 MAG: hypothetical protein BGO26_10235 [Actinobacteria bacterium 69-20]